MINEQNFKHVKIEKKFTLYWRAKQIGISEMETNIIEEDEEKEKIINTGCCHDCGGRCVLKVHTKNGKIIRIETDNDNEPQLRACVRGRAYRQRVYSAKRLKYPLRRVGERGEGKFEKISWDEALTHVASKILEIKENYGNAAILLVPGGGNQGMLHGITPVGIMLNQIGGYTRMWGAPYMRVLFLLQWRHIEP